MRGKNMTHNRRCRVLAGLLCLCMFVSVFSGFQIAAFAAESPAGSPTSGATRQADPSTMDAYQEVLDFSESTRYAGRLWTDKTVFAYDYDNGDDDWAQNALTLDAQDDGVGGKITLDADFLHVFSAMGSSLNVNTQNTRPLDVVILLDISTSMTDQTQGINGSNDPLHQMLDDADELLTTLMNNADELGGQVDPSIHTDNRVGVVVYGGGAQVLMDLDHYTSSGKDGHYLELDSRVAKPGGNAYFPRIKANVQGGKTSGYMFGDSTYLQGALYQGMGMLADASFGGGTDNTEGRIPVLIVLSDGGTNVVTANSVTGTQSAYTFDPTKAYNAPDQTYSQFQIPAGVSWYNPFNGIMPIRSITSSWLMYTPLAGNPVYGALSNESQLTPDLRSAIMMSNLLLAGSMQKRIEEHYSKGAPNSKTSMYGYSILLNSRGLGNNEKEMMHTTLDPVNYLKSDSRGPSGGEDGEGTLRNYASARTAYSWLNEYIAGNTTVSKTATGNWGYGKTATFNFNHLAGENEKYDVTSLADLYYIDKSITTESGGLGDIFSQIVDEVTTNIFVPVGGGNDLGADDAVTYMDPMGKYMEVKDVKNLVLFGKKYDITETAVYSYEWNALYMRNSNDNADGNALPAGWYKGDPVEGDNTGVQVVLNGLPPACSSAEDAWDNGWVYRVGFQIAAEFIPSLEEISSPDDISEKQKNTEYTFYRIAESEAERKKLRMNPAYGTEDNIPPRIQYNANGEHLQTPGVYTLADLRIWVENTGDYNDSQVESGAVQSDANFDEALYVHVPANMLPLRTVTVNEKTGGETKYTTNQNTTFPLRVFYTVGIESSLLTSDGSLDIAAGVSANYIKDNKITEVSAGEDARNIPAGAGDGVVEFFSNWYNPESRYAAYDYSRLNNGDYTFGDPVVSFSPSTDNRYYVFEKALPLYNRAFVYKDNQWKQVSLTETGADPTAFGGKLVYQDLDVTLGSGADANALITAALNAENITGIQDGNIVFLKSDRLADVTRPGTVNGANPDPFASTGYYYMALEYFELHGDEAERVQYAVVRKGSEFGSAYQSAGITNGDMLCWHDVSGKYPDYHYLSYSDTGDSTRGYNYIGYDYDEIFNTDAEGNKTTLKTLAQLAGKADEAREIREGGDWVVSARPGGLRVGDLTQSVGNKGGDYNSYSEAYINERFSNASSQNLTWGYYEDNVTRTANNYYLPTVSTASNLGNENIIINVYLGNNGRLLVQDTTLVLTKLVEPGPSGILPSDDSGKEFDFQVYIRDFVGARDAIRVRYNQATKTWQRQVHSIDLELDGNRFLQTNDGQKVIVDKNGRRVVQIQGNLDQNTYVYADDSSACTGDLYYVRVADLDQSDVGGASTAFRLYHNQYCEDRDATVKGENVVVHYYTGNGAEETKAEGDKVPEDFNGKRDFYAASGVMSFVSKDEYDGTESAQVGSLDGEPFENEFYLATMDPMAKTDSGDTNVDVESPYNIQSTFLTQTLYFGYKYGATGTGDTITGDALTQDDLYVPVSDAAYSGNANPEANTAEVKLESGWGLLFSSIDSGVDYVLAERLDDNTITEGYSFARVNQVTQSTNTNKLASEFQGYDYYVSGDTGSKEEAGHFINTWSNDKTETEINGQDIPNSDSSVKPGVQVDDEISFEVKWFNDTGKSARVVITDPLDEGVDFVSADSNGRYFQTKDRANAYLKAQGLDFTVDYGHVVIWDLKNQPAKAKGTVNLTVKVNEKAPKWWSYNNDGVANEPVDANTPNDFLVRNRATVRVAGNVWNTNTVLNPVGEPKKTETHIERGEDSRASDYKDENVTETGANANLLPSADGKYKGPLVFAGDKITYEISWRNYEDQDAAISISDPLDANVRFVSAEYDPDDFEDRDGNPLTGLEPGTEQKIEAASDNANVESPEEVEGYGDDGKEKRNTITYDAEHHTVIWNPGIIPSGARGKVTLVVEVLESAIPAGYVDNTAYVQVGNEVQQTRTVTNPTPYQEKTEVTPGDGVMVQVGDSITYEVNWTNYKTEPARVVIMDTLDPGVDFVEANLKGTYYRNGGILSVDGVNGIPAHTVVWVLENQPAGTKGTVTLTVKVNEKAKLDYTYNENADGFESSDGTDYEVLNQARIKVGNDAFLKTQIVENPVPEKTETSVSHTTGEEDSNPSLTPKPDADNTYTGPLVFVEDEITYKIHWKNGHKEKADVIISDPLDKGVDFVSADNGGAYDSNTHTVIWKLVDQEPGSEGTVELQVKVNAKATEAGIVKNQARVKVGNDPLVETEIIENPTPHEEKTEVDPGEGMQVMPGDEIDYQITWHNYEKEEADVVITDKLDPGVDFVSAGIAGLNGDKLVRESNTRAQAGSTVPSNSGKGEDTGSAMTDSVPDPAPEAQDEPEPTADDFDLTTAAQNKPEPTVDDFDPAPEAQDEPEPTTDDFGPAPEAQDKPEPTEDDFDPTPEAQDEPEPTEDDSDPTPGSDQYKLGDEEPTFSKTLTDQNIHMYYFKEAHTVVWVLEKRPANSDGVVDLKVLVNETAEKFWSYADPSADPSDDLNDNRVRNQAGVKVANNPEVKTRIIENPTKPEKTETSVNDTDVSRDLVVNGDDYVGPEVNVGDTITYQITWQNNASDKNNQPAKAQITITDELDSGVDFVSASNGGSYNKNTHTVIWNLGEKNARERGIVTLTVRVNSKAAAPEKVENAATVTVGNKATQTNKVENHVGLKGGLKVTKIVSGDEGETNRNWDFTVTLSDKSISGQYGDMFFIDGVATFYLKHNESIISNGLPANIRYTVVEKEANQDGYTTSSTGEKGTIPERNIAEAGFVNYKESSPPEEHYGRLVITKTVTGNEGDPNKDWHFRVELSDKSINGQYSDMFFTSGVAEFTLKHGERATALNLPEGITYTVTEAEADQDGYTTSASGATGTILGGGTAKAEFVNDKNDDTPSPPDNTPGNPSNNPPKTGEDSHLGFWLTLMLLSMVGIIVNIYFICGRRYEI